MRWIDLIHFLKQIFFPNRNAKNDRAETNPEKDSRDDGVTRLERWEDFRDNAFRRLRSGEFVGSTVSVVVHLVLLLILSSLFFPPLKKWEGIDLLGGFTPPKIETPAVAILPGTTSTDEAPRQESDAPQEKPKDAPNLVQHPESMSPDLPPSLTPDIGDISDQDERPVGGSERERSGEFVSGGGYEGRTREGRGRSVGVGDCSAKGENAVEAGLAWIAAHQIRAGRHKGGWCFDFEDTCRRCSHGGSHGSRVAATALALLPFLGAGYTHEGTPVENPYKNIVEDGLFYLIVRARENNEGCDFLQATDRMYSQGIVTMALCEAYAMSRRKPRQLTRIAQEAIRFIEESQDPRTGGWRYDPRQSPGDLSVTAWQVMALKSAKLGGLNVSQPTIYGAVDFLDLVQDDGGRVYHYLPQNVRDPKRGVGEDSATNSNVTGLLLRMYLGWKPGDRPLDEGLDRIARIGPLKPGPDGQGTSCNLYYAYYATLAMHHYDGSHWDGWNRTVREFLIETQSRSGHESGSWYFPDYYCDKGGRLLNTSLALLILETPYRIMPLFRKP